MSESAHNLPEPPRCQHPIDEQMLELAVAACRRGCIERQEAAFAFLSKAFPAAPAEMVRSLAFHIYFDLPVQAMRLAAEVELSLREGQHRVHCGVLSPILYDLYNALQIERLMPEGKQRILDLIGDIEDNLKVDAIDYVKENVAELRRILGGTESAPNFE